MAELERIKARLVSLCQQGREALATHQKSYVDAPSFKKWQTGSMSFVEQLFGADSVYFVNFDEDV